MADNDNELARKGVRVGNKLLTGIIAIWSPAASDKIGSGITEAGELFIGPELPPIKPIDGAAGTPPGAMPKSDKIINPDGTVTTKKDQ